MAALDILAQQVRDSAWSVRFSALEELSMLAPTEDMAVAHIAERLFDGDQEIVERAAAHLQELGRKASVALPQIISACKEGRPAQQALFSAAPGLDYLMDLASTLNRAIPSENVLEIYIQEFCLLDPRPLGSVCDAYVASLLQDCGDLLCSHGLHLAQKIAGKAPETVEALTKLARSELKDFSLIDYVRVDGRLLLADKSLSPIERHELFQDRLMESIETFPKTVNIGGASKLPGAVEALLHLCPEVVRTQPELRKALSIYRRVESVTAANARIQTEAWGTTHESQELDVKLRTPLTADDFLQPFGNKFRSALTQMNTLLPTLKFTRAEHLDQLLDLFEFAWKPEDGRKMFAIELDALRELSAEVAVRIASAIKPRCLELVPLISRYLNASVVDGMVLSNALLALKEFGLYAKGALPQLEALERRLTEQMNPSVDLSDLNNFDGYNLTVVRQMSSIALEQVRRTKRRCGG